MVLSSAPLLSKRWPRLESEFENLRSALKIPGLSIAVVQDQRLLWAKGLGFADLEHHQRATENTPYPIASVTKPFAATLLLQLLEQKKLSLDDPMSKYHPRDFQTDRVRVRHILTHTARASMPGMNPGDKYECSGSFFGYLGFVIAKCAGKSYRDQLVTQILEPLHMTDSVPGHDVLDGSPAPADAYGPTARARYAEVLKRLAKPYTLYGANKNILSPYPPRGVNSAAGLISTVVDLAKFDIAIDRHLLLTADTQNLAWTPARANDGKQIPYGLGWFVQDYQGLKLVWHYGQWPTFSGLILKVPEKRLTLLLLANSTGLSAPFEMADGDVLSSPFALAFVRTIIDEEKYQRALPAPDWRMAEDIFSADVAKLQQKAGGYRYVRESEAHVAIRKYLTSRLARERPEITVKPETLDSYVGKYQIDSRQTVTITRRPDGLMVEYPGQSPVALFSESETEFFVKIADVQVFFVKDDTGRVVNLVLKQSGNKRTAMKIAEL